MKKSICILIFAISCVASAKGTNSGGGGDNCEPRIQEIRDDILNWIQKGGPKRFKDLPILASKYSSRMSAYLLTNEESNGAITPVTQIECVHHPIEVQGVEKICRFDQFNWGPKITCYAEGFMDKKTMSVDEQYRLIHHEFAGIAGLEVPSHSQSSYTYSNQLSAFLENQVVKKLAVYPKAARSSYSKRFTGGMIFDANDIEASAVPAGSGDHCFNTYKAVIVHKTLGTVFEYGDIDCGTESIRMIITRANLLINSARENQKNIQVGGVTIHNAFYLITWPFNAFDMPIKIVDAE